MKRRKPLSEEERSQVLERLRRDHLARLSGYREQALRILPRVCGRCGRDFEGRRLKELTVHHRDHNHDNNPPDGSNWELLCSFCHESEHSRGLEADRLSPSGPSNPDEPAPLHSPFADLASRLKDKKQR